MNFQNPKEEFNKNTTVLIIGTVVVVIAGLYLFLYKKESSETLKEQPKPQENNQVETTEFVSPSLPPANYPKIPPSDK